MWAGYGEARRNAVVALSASVPLVEPPHEKEGGPSTRGEMVEAARAEIEKSDFLQGSEPWAVRALLETIDMREAEIERLTASPLLVPHDQGETERMLADLREAATALYEQVEMDESVGICLSERAPSLILGAVLSRLTGDTGEDPPSRSGDGGRQ